MQYCAQFAKLKGKARTGRCLKARFPLGDKYVAQHKFFLLSCELSTGIGRGTGGTGARCPTHFFQNWKMCPFSIIKIPFF